MATVARLNVTPLKSASLHHPDSIELTESGVEGDHRFMLLEADGRRVSGAAKAPLLGIVADLDDDGTTLGLRFPGGNTIVAAAAPAGDPFEVELYRRHVRVREIPGPLPRALSDHVGRPLRLVRVQEPEHAGGVHRASIISLASVADLGRRAGTAESPDSRRFRMLIELDGREPYEEDSWSTRRVRVGAAVLKVAGSVPRCVLTNLDPDSGERDFPALDVLAQYRRRGTELLLGVYADVEAPGAISVGDAVEILD